MTGNHGLVVRWDNLLYLSKLVLVDDEQDITRLFHDPLKGINGITIFTFTDPILALEHFQKNKDACVLVVPDSRMPALNGTELLKKMKDTNKHVRTILRTAFDMEVAILKDYTKSEMYSRRRVYYYNMH